MFLLLFHLSLQQICIESLCPAMGEFLGVQWEDTDNVFLPWDHLLLGEIVNSNESVNKDIADCTGEG